MSNKPTYKQPDYIELWDAYAEGARDGQKHPQASEYMIKRSADAYCKLVHQRLDPVMFKSLTQGNFN